jgi:hypothetical protein
MEGHAKSLEMSWRLGKSSGKVVLEDHSSEME